MRYRARMCADSEGREHLRLLLDVARRYWLDDQSQAEIAAAVGYSRPTVSRLLAEAKALGMVTVSVSHPMEHVLDTEHDLRRRFSLKVATVAARTEGLTTAQAVARLAAATVCDLGNPHAVIALSNGTSLAAVVDVMPRQRWRYSCVTQMIGALGRPDDAMADSPELCRRLAGRLGGTYRSLPIPIVMRSPAAAETARAEELVLTTFELAARSDIGLVGVGAVSRTGMSGGLLEPFLTREVAAEIRRVKAVAHICGHHFDARGRHVRTSLCDRTVAMDPERLAQMEVAMVVAWGAGKVRALHAALRTGYVNALATDEETARLLLAYDP